MCIRNTLIYIMISATDHPETASRVCLYMSVIKSECCIVCTCPKSFHLGMVTHACLPGTTADRDLYIGNGGIHWLRATDNGVGRQRGGVAGSVNCLHSVHLKGRMGVEGRWKDHCWSILECRRNRDLSSISHCVGPRCCRVVLANEGGGEWWAGASRCRVNTPVSKRHPKLRKW